MEYTLRDLGCYAERLAGEMWCCRGGKPLYKLGKRPVREISNDGILSLKEYSDLMETQRIARETKKKSKPKTKKSQLMARILASGNLVEIDRIAKGEHPEFNRKGTCNYCGDKDIWFSKDHFIPRSKVKTPNKNILIDVCKPCNYQKADLMPEWYIHELEHLKEEINISSHEFTRINNIQKSIQEYIEILNNK